MFVNVMLFVAALLPPTGKELTSLTSLIESFLVVCHFPPGVPGHVVLRDFLMAFSLSPKV